MAHVRTLDGSGSGILSHIHQGCDISCFNRNLIGSLAGNLIGLTRLLGNYLAGVGSVVLTFLAGAEVDPEESGSISYPV